MLGNALRFLKANSSTGGYDLEVSRAASGWRVGIYPRTADLPILGRCEIFATDPDEAVVIAKDRVDGANLL
jgi:hypothetical protein